MEDFEPEDTQNVPPWMSQDKSLQLYRILVFQPRVNFPYQYSHRITWKSKPR